MRSVVRIFSMLAIMAFIMPANFAFAFSTPTDLYDQTTSLKTSSGSNHRFVFTTPVAIPESDIVTITFPSGFDLTSIAEDDIDISSGAIDLTTASDCANTEEVGFSVSSQSLLFEICAGDGGTVVLGSEVVIEIGSNASSSGSGANRITNPSSAATYFVWVQTNTNELSGSVLIPIVADDDGNVSTTIPESGGGGPGPGPGDGGDDGGGDEDPVDDEDPIDDEDPVDDGDPVDDSDPVDDGEPTDGTDSDTSGAPDDPDSSGGVPDEVVEREVDTQITVGNGQIFIDQDDLIPGTYAQVEVTVGDPEEIDQVIVVVDDTTYGFAEVLDGIYQGIIPVTKDDQVVTVIVDYTDGEVVTDVQSWGVAQYGWVYEDLEGESRGVEDVVVIIYEGSGDERVQWDAGSYGQSNPTFSGGSGAIAFYVPNGTYTVTAGKNGYEDAEVTVRVTNNVLAPVIEVVRTIEIVGVVDEEPEGVVVTTVTAAVDTVVVFAETINEVRELPAVQAAASVTKPVAIATVVGSAGVLSSSFNLIPFLRYLFSSPILFFARRKRKRIGTIYNAITKLPIDLATIRLYSESGKLVKTTVSDGSGNYILRVKPGKYRVEVKKAGFVFPSEYVQGADADEMFEDIYTQGIIEVTEGDVVIAANIPIDPSQDDKYHAPKKLIFKRFLRTFQNVLAIAGLIMALVILVIQPSIVSIGLVAVHVMVYGVTKLLTKWRKKKGWGIVSDAGIKKALPNAVVRLFEPKFHKLIESTITDGSGRYAFMAGPNQYYMTFEKPGYEKQEVGQIDLSGKKEPELISVDTLLKKQS